MNAQNLSMEIPTKKLGPPGIRWHLHILAQSPKQQRTDEERLADKSERSFKIYARLSKFPSGSESMLHSFSEEDGGSYLLTPTNAAYIKVDSPDGQFIIRKNRLGEFSLVEFTCISTTDNGAKHKFLRGIMPFFDYVSYFANAPTFVTSLRIEDINNQNQIIEYTGPYQKSIVNPHRGQFRNEMSPVYAMYHEALKSNSDFYKFLCYYKILEGLLGPMRAAVFKTAREQGLELTRGEELVPDSADIFDANYRAYIGKSVKKFVDDVLEPRFRNAVAKAHPVVPG
jgi:hypothetical protein